MLNTLPLPVALGTYGSVRSAIALRGRVGGRSRWFRQSILSKKADDWGVARSEKGSMEWGASEKTLLPLTPPVQPLGPSESVAPGKWLDTYAFAVEGVVDMLPLLCTAIMAISDAMGAIAIAEGICVGCVAFAQMSEQRLHESNAAVVVEHK